MTICEAYLLIFNINFIFEILIMIKHFYASIITLIILLNYSQSTATTFTSIASGYWTDSHIWQNGIAPALTTSDTVIIRNFVEFDSEIHLLGPAFLFIDTNGALCGHDAVYSEQGSAITDYGIFECDVMWVTGGNILFYMPGHIIFYQYAHLSNGASMYSNASIVVGPWFYCISKGTGVGEIADDDISFFPNPAENVLHFSDEILFDNYEIYDVNGRLLQKDSRHDSFLNISALPNGIYIVRFYSDRTVMTKKFIKE